MCRVDCALLQEIASDRDHFTMMAGNMQGKRELQTSEPHQSQTTTKHQVAARVIEEIGMADRDQKSAKMVFLAFNGEETGVFLCFYT